MIWENTSLPWYIQAFGANAQKAQSLTLDVQVVTRQKYQIQQVNHQLTRSQCENVGTLLKLAESFCKQHGLTPLIGTSIEGMLKMLAANRLDVVLLTSGTPLSLYPGHEDTLVTQSNPLLVVKAVHVFGARWADYAPRFDAAVRAFRADGRYVKFLPTSP